MVLAMMLDCLSGASAEQKEQQRMNQNIEKLLKDDKERARREFKLLLLGTGGSGKSTFVKQMRIIHGLGYKDNDKREYRTAVYHNIYEAIKKLVYMMAVYKIDYHNPVNKENAEVVRQTDYTTMDSLDEEMATIFKDLWEDKGIQQCYNKRYEFHLIESAKYYLSEIDRIGKPDYLPTETDILRARSRTTGIVEYLFKIDSSLFRIVDVGGQRTERRKWLHCFENCHSIIFLTALSEYDQTLEEDNNANSLQESYSLFQHILSYDWFSETTIILFLNKTDLLKEKVKLSHLDDYFPDYTGPKHDDESARQFILSLFLEISKQQQESRMIYSHFTCATDTKNIKFVFAAVKDSIMNEHLKIYNLV